MTEPQSVVDLVGAVETRIQEPGIGRICVYHGGPETADAPPMLLVHSVNAAASAHEMAPLYAHHARSRTVYAIDLPGFGQSERRQRRHTPSLMCDAIGAVLAFIQARHGAAPVDAVALSLGSEFLARLAMHRPQAFRTLALISPTGLNARAAADGAGSGDRGVPWLRQLLGLPLLRDLLFSSLTSKVSIRYFLRRTWGGAGVPESLVEAAWRCSHQPGAVHAPLDFLCGMLFSRDMPSVYRALRMPIWVAHGERGDFTDYSGLDELEARPNWSRRVYPGGAMPHFEFPAAFIDDHDRFLSRPGAANEVWRPGCA